MAGSDVRRDLPVEPADQPDDGTNARAAPLSQLVLKYDTTPPDPAAAARMVDQWRAHGWTD